MQKLNYNRIVLFHQKIHFNKVILSQVAFLFSFQISRSLAVFTSRAMKNSKICHATPQVCACSYVPYNVLQISCIVPQRTPWHFRLCSFHYSKLIWVKPVWPFHDNAT